MTLAASSSYAQTTSPAVSSGNSVAAAPTCSSDSSRDNIVWGTSIIPGGLGANDTGDCAAASGDDNDSSFDNIVWGTGISSDDDVDDAARPDNIVWGTSLSSDDNIVWGTGITHR
jgi:hypothetical protein